LRRFSSRWSWMMFAKSEDVSTGMVLLAFGVLGLVGGGL
jgi:hypothetical protein